MADAVSGIMWPEGMAPGQINNSARATMAEIKKSFGGGPSSFSTFASDPNGLSTAVTTRLALDFAATSPVMSATAGYEVVQLSSGTYYAYVSLYLYNQTAGGTLVAQSPESTLKVTDAYPQGASRLAANLTLGQTYRLAVRARTTTDNSCRLGLITIQGICA
jgi:hypothetical protein